MPRKHPSSHALLQEEAGGVQPVQVGDGCPEAHGGEVSLKLFTEYSPGPGAVDVKVDKPAT